jgi:sulfane dehydrogenase subunit SoxC
MSDDQEFSSSRRKFLGGAAVATGACDGQTGACAGFAGSADHRVAAVAAVSRRWRGCAALRHAVAIRGPCGAPQRAVADGRQRQFVNFTPLHEMEGIITPNGLAFERHHGGVAEIDPGMHRLMINGLVDTPLVFTMEDLMRFPRENRTYFLECAANTGMEWRGRAAEWLSVHAWDDPQRRLYRRAAAPSARRSGRADECRVDPARRARTPRP